MEQTRKTKVEVSFLRAQLLTELTNLFHQSKDYSLSQHLYHIINCPKNNDTVYEWTDEELIIRVKEYSNKLLTEEEENE